MIDPTRLLEKLIPEKDGEPYLTYRKGVITAVNSNGTIDITLSGVAVTGVPVIGETTDYVVGRTAHLLAAKGLLLALGTAASGGSTAKPNAYFTFGTPTITNNSLTTLTPNAVPVNDGSMWTSGTNFVVPTGQGGLYEMGLALQYASQATAAGIRMARFRKNGSDITYAAHTVAATGLNSTLTPGFAVARNVLAAGDIITFHAFHTAGADLALNASSHGWLERVR